jgi:CRISPR/Cas system-associated exonuclease Cas4 (RecB family)
VTIAIPEPTLPPALVRARELYLAGAIDPTDVPCICGAKHSEHAGPTHAGKGPDDCRRYRADLVAEMAAGAVIAADHGFDESMRAYDKQSRARRPKKKPGTVSVRPSDVGACPRSVWYRETPPEGYEPLDSPRGAADIGTLIHEEFQKRRAALYRWRFYADLDKRHELQLPGSDRGYKFDEYDPILGRLISIKTAGSWRWDVTGDHGPDEKWWDQDHAYAFLMNAKGYPVVEIEVLVIERESGKSERHLMPYDAERGRLVVERLLNLRRLLEEGKTPPRTEPGPATSKLCSTYCPARAHCWNVAEADALGVSPENYTILGLTPEEDRVASVAEELVQLRERRLSLEKDEKELKAILDGVDLKPYGEYEPVEGTSTSTAWKEWEEEIKRIFALPEWDRPEQLPQPRHTRRTNYTWKRLRKATRERLEKERQAALEAAQAALEVPAGEEGTPTVLTVVSERLAPTGPLELPAAEAS